MLPITIVIVIASVTLFAAATIAIISYLKYKGIIC